MKLVLFLFMLVLPFSAFALEGPGGAVYGGNAEYTQRMKEYEAILNTLNNNYFVKNHMRNFPIKSIEKKGNEWIITNELNIKSKARIIKLPDGSLYVGRITFDDTNIE